MLQKNKIAFTSPHMAAKSNQKKFYSSSPNFVWTAPCINTANKITVGFTTVGFNNVTIGFVFE